MELVPKCVKKYPHRKSGLLLKFGRRIRPKRQQILDGHAQQKIQHRLAQGVHRSNAQRMAEALEDLSCLMARAKEQARKQAEA